MLLPEWKATTNLTCLLHERWSHGLPVVLEVAFLDAAQTRLFDRARQQLTELCHLSPEIWIRTL